MDDPDANLPTRVLRRPVKRQGALFLVLIVELAITFVLVAIVIVALRPPTAWSP
jgi:hypothetical protein